MSMSQITEIPVQTFSLLAIFPQQDLLKAKMIKQIKDENDTRKKNLFLDKEGKIFFETVYNIQKKRIFNALKNSSSDSVIKFKEVLKKIIDGK